MHCQSRISRIVAEWANNLDKYLKLDYSVVLLNGTKVNGFNTIIKRVLIGLSSTNTKVQFRSQKTVHQDKY